MVTESSKRATTRYRFKNSTCFKVCDLHVSKGGFCGANREQIEHCLSLSLLKKDGRDYRSIETTLEWVEVFCEEKGIEFEVTPVLRQQIADALVNTTRDCYTIALKIVEEIKTWQGLVQLQVV